MINFIKKIFFIFEEHPDKKRKSSKGIVGTQGTSWSQRNYLGNQTVEFVKIANKARNQKKQ
jgi:hypothetical protein